MVTGSLADLKVRSERAETDPMDIEGLSLADALDLDDSELDDLVFVGRPIVFRIGSARILGQFRRQPERLTIELAQIEGGGEGVLPTLVRLATAYARRLGASQIEWLVHAVNCAEPNLKLRRVLERKGFQIREIDGIGEVYYLLSTVPNPTSETA